jgi:hypothetical protein
MEAILSKRILVGLAAVLLLSALQVLFAPSSEARPPWMCMKRGFRNGCRDAVTHCRGCRFNPPRYAGARCWKLYRKGYKKGYRKCRRWHHSPWASGPGSYGGHGSRRGGRGHEPFGEYRDGGARSHGRPDRRGRH